MPALRHLIILAACAAATVHADTVMHWVDADGQVHYSDRVPPDAEDTAVAVEVDPDHNVYEAPPTPSFTPSAPPAHSARDRAAARRATAEEKERQARCAKYQEKLEQVRSRMRAGYKASQYNRLMERERTLKAKIETYCQ